MREVSHSDLVTMVRNNEGEVLARIDGEDVCCNPSEETQGLMAEDAAAMVEADAAEDEPDESQGETQEPVEGGQEAASE